MKERRASHLFFVMLLGFVILSLNLVRMQVIQGEFYQLLSKKNRLRVIFLEAPRGKITDRNQKLLALNRLSFNLSALPRDAKQDIDQSCQILAQVLGEDASELKGRFLKRKPGVYNTVLIAQDIMPSKAMALEEKLDALPGFVIETRPQREYPFGESLAHVVGFIGPLNHDELEALEVYGYKADEWLGRDGLEKYYENYLHGESGGLQVEVDSRARWVQVLGMKEPQEGKDLRLTIDASLSDFVQKLLGPQRGSVVVMDLKDGGILSLNSSPSYDPNLFSSTKGRKDVGKVLHDLNSPMLNRAIAGRYPPGSIFKIVTAFAALNQRKIYSLSSFNCPGYRTIGGNRFNCWQAGGHGMQTLSQAFAHSCNVFFYSSGILVGIDALNKKAVELGFAHGSGIDLPGEKSGFVPSREWKRRSKHQAWFEGETANLAIGQGYLQVTPMQALVMIATVATEGKILKPHLVDQIQGNAVDGGRVKHLHADVSGWAEIKNGLDAVINSESGTGRLARVPGLRLAGKTGTAQSGQDKTHAWFVGFAPFRNPKVAMVVFLENGGRGGVQAARLASVVFGWLKDNGYA